MRIAIFDWGTLDKVVRHPEEHQTLVGKPFRVNETVNLTPNPMTNTYTHHGTVYCASMPTIPNEDIPKEFRGEYDFLPVVTDWHKFDEDMLLAHLGSSYMPEFLAIDRKSIKPDNMGLSRPYDFPPESLRFVSVQYGNQTAEEGRIEIVPGYANFQVLRELRDVVDKITGRYDQRQLARSVLEATSGYPDHIIPLKEHGERESFLHMGDREHVVRTTPFSCGRD
ncbi:MAG: hypothetical protein ABII01_04070 [Candidatus Woesearchaeota archaeon]